MENPNSKTLGEEDAFAIQDGEEEGEEEEGQEEKEENPLTVHQRANFYVVGDCESLHQIQFTSKEQQDSASRATNNREESKRCIAEDNNALKLLSMED